MNLKERAVLKDKLLKNVRYYGDCWIWNKSYSKQTGYAQMTFMKRIDSVHRISYECFNKKIPRGLVIDHLCRNRLCVNPLHLEAVTSRENIMRGLGICSVNARKTHCPQGHKYSEENTYVCSKGKRSCKACTKSERVKFRRRFRYNNDSIHRQKVIDTKKKWIEVRKKCLEKRKNRKYKARNLLTSQHHR